MEEYREEQMATLGQLIGVSEDLGSAYLAAAENETHEHMKHLYLQYAAATAKAVAELKTELGILGGDEDEMAGQTEDGSAVQIDRTSIQDQQRRSLSLYEKAMDLPWPGNILETLSRHFTVLEESEGHLAELGSMGSPEMHGKADSDTPDSYREDRREAA